MKAVSITFGGKYRTGGDVHPTFPAAHPDGWLVILVPDDHPALTEQVNHLQVARAWAFAQLGSQWAFDYNGATPVRDGDEPGEGLTDWYPRGVLGIALVTEPIERAVIL